MLVLLKDCCKVDTCAPYPVTIAVLQCHFMYYCFNGRNHTKLISNYSNRKPVCEPYIPHFSNDTDRLFLIVLGFFLWIINWKWMPFIVTVYKICYSLVKHSSSLNYEQCWFISCEPNQMDQSMSRSNWRTQS